MARKADDSECIPDALRPSASVLPPAIAAPPSLFHPAAYPVVKPATDMIARKINATIPRAATLAVQISTSQPTRYCHFRRSEGDRTFINDNPRLF
jgi:hypothetical protein